MHRTVLLFVLALVFSLGLLFASVELPQAFDKLITTPDFDHTASEINMGKSELFIRHYHLRFWGYLSLSIVVMLILTSLFTKRNKAAIIGAFAMFLPVFGHFALAMFFLAGLGFLRFIWLPFTELVPFSMRLGEIVTVPYDLLLNLGKLFNQNWHTGIAVGFIALGILLFVLGVFAWFSTKFNKKNVVDIWIYRISRHPQYLGWILWSYGMFVFPVENQKRAWEYPDSLPWMIATIIIVAVSLLEEIKVHHQYGEEYTAFRNKTAFMFPLPLRVKKLIKHPVKLFFKKYDLSRKREVAVFALYYIVFFMVLSYLLLVFRDPSIPFKPLNEYRTRKVVRLVSQLKQGETRREKDLAALHLEKFKGLSLDPLIELLAEPNYHARNYAIRTLGNIGDVKAGGDILAALKDTSIDVRHESLLALGKLNYEPAAEEIEQYLNCEDSGIRIRAALTLSKFHSKKALVFLLSEIGDAEKYTKISLIEGLGYFNTEESVDALIGALRDKEPLVVAAAIVSLVKLKAKKAIQYLLPLQNSADWEIRIYAEEAVKTLGTV